jgi:hypothetical protein
MAGLIEFYCRSNETSHASQFKWLDNTFNVYFWESFLISDQPRPQKKNTKPHFLAVVAMSSTHPLPPASANTMIIATSFLILIFSVWQVRTLPIRASSVLVDGLTFTGKILGTLLPALFQEPGMSCTYIYIYKYAFFNFTYFYLWTSSFILAFSCHLT